MTATPHVDLVIPELLQGQWTTAMVCTFGADLNFFETRLMSQLAQVPLRIILADDKHLAATLAEAARTGQRHRLANKAYVAAPIRHPRAAHGKLMLLLGPAAGLLVAGSGNLGYEGYAAPGELWHVFAYSDDKPRHVSEFAAAREFVDGLAGRGLIDPPVVDLLQTAWGQATWLPPAPETPAVIIGNLDRPIIDQLRDAASEPVDELIVHAPFHDADCAALQELITSFAPRHVRLLVTDATSADPTAIDRVLATASKSNVERVQVKTEPAAYIHAKWVHLIRSDSETLLTGSANLSRAALLRSAQNGNVEIGLISSGTRGAFDALYAHLQREPVKDVTSLGISHRGTGVEPDPATHPVVLWSRVDGTTLTLVFSEMLPDGVVLDLQDHAGTALTWTSLAIDDDTVRISLSKASAELVSDGGRVQVRLDNNKDGISMTWPYNLAHLRSRLDKASHREHLPRIGDLPEQDAELYELLQELDQTLIIDRASVWRIAKPKEPPPPDSDEDAPLIKLQDLDWDRVRRDPRYGGYFTLGRAAGLTPTDIQVILAAIAGRLGEIGVSHLSDAIAEDDDLAREGDATSSQAEAAEEAEDELEDELTRRRLPISTRTRMAFDRFVQRYAAALADTAFIDELGPVPAATNAVVFDHLLARLLERDSVRPDRAIDAQIATWQFLWGDGKHPALGVDLDHEAADVVDKILRDAGTRAATLRGLAATLDHELDDDQAVALRDIARQLLTSAEFGLDTRLLTGAAGGTEEAIGYLTAIAHLAEPTTPGEIIDDVVAPYGIERTDADWHTDSVQRSGRRYVSSTLVIRAPIADLTVYRAHEILERVAIAAYLADHDISYVRVRFAGNGWSVAYWDDDVQTGVALVGDEDVDLESFQPPWPAWIVRIDELFAALGESAGVERSA